MLLSAGGKEIELFCEAPLDNSGSIFLLYGGGEKGELIWTETRRRTDAPFALAVIPVADWEKELSPWPAKAVFRGGDDFGDGAGETVRVLKNDILPAVRAALGSPESLCYVAGYSLAGLFALYALYETDCFDGALSASGSLWFPGFSDYAGSRQPPRPPRRVYLSLGDRESRTKNPVMAQVEERTEALCRQLQAQGVDCVFELNPGNHFQDPEGRLAKGIARLLRP